MKLGKKLHLISLPVLVILVCFFGIEQIQGQESNVTYNTLPQQAEVSIPKNQAKISNIQALASALPGADVNVSNIAGKRG